MVGGKLEKGSYFVFLLAVSFLLNMASESSTCVWVWVNPRVCSIGHFSPSFESLVSAIESVLPIHARYSREVKQKFRVIWVPWSILLIKALSIIDSSCVIVFFILENLVHVLSQWWGKHHGPPSTGLLLSTTSRFPRVWLRNRLVPLICSHHWQVSLFPSVDLHHWSSGQNILSGVRCQLIHLNSVKCIIVSWRPSILMVVLLTLVNGSHHWPVIKWFLPCSVSTHLFTCIES